jgi:hypothetical protein
MQTAKKKLTTIGYCFCLTYIFYAFHTAVEENSFTLFMLHLFWGPNTANHIFNHKTRI